MNLFDTIELYQYDVLSMADRYKKNSFNQLRLSGMVLPIYTVNGNKNQYITGASVTTQMREEIVKAIKSYKNIIGDLSEYDADNDGYIDCLHIITSGILVKTDPQPSGLLISGAKLELYDGIKMDYMVSIGANDRQNPNAYKEIATHETGHALGLPDNYNTYNPSSLVAATLSDI